MDTSLAHENARLRALLQTQQDTIRQMAEYNRLLSQRVAAYASEINRLKALVAKLQRMQFGKSSEKLRAKTERQIQEAQERISALQEEMAETLGEQYDPVLPSALRQSSARKPLPASLPRETRVIRPEEECCPACGGELSSLGCDVSEQLELISSAFKVIETQRPKQACCRCDHIVQAPVPSKPIARSYAGAGLLAHVVTGKYADHLPLYRQSEIYRRQGVELSRATLGRWTGAVAELLEPLYDVLRQYVLMPGKVHADDIPVPVQEPGSGKTRTARLWVYVRDDRNAGSQMPPAVWFAYSPDRKGIHPQNHLAGYSGVLQADAYGGYRALYESGRITEAACMAHARRKIHDVHARAPTYITDDYARAFEQVDAILMPASPTAAFKFGELSDPTQMYLSDLFTISINIAGNGGVTVPMGLGEDSGMPVAAQLVGKPFDDVRLLSFARAVERAATEAGAASVLPVAPAFAEKGGELA